MNDLWPHEWSMQIIPGIQIETTKAFESIVQLRFTVLRAPLGLSLDSARFVGDESPGTFHFLGSLGDYPVACATLVHARPEDAKVVPPSLRPLNHASMQLRGMAVADGYRGKNLGQSLLQAVHEWASANRESLWCHARVSAAGFYRRQNWQDCSNPFDIPPIGAHIVMSWTPDTV